MPQKRGLAFRGGIVLVYRVALATQPNQTKTNMIKKTLLALAVLTAGVSAQAQTAVAAQSSALSVTADISYVSQYVFRGLLQADDSIQPSIKATYGDFYAGVWYSDAVNTVNVNGDRPVSPSETDLYIGYGYKVSESIKLDVGVTRYLYEGQSTDDITEFYVGASVDTFLKPSVYAYYAEEAYNAGVATYTASIGHSIALSFIGSSLDLSALVGFVNAYDNEEYLYGVLSAAIPYKLSENATLTVGVDYVANDDDRFDNDYGPSGAGGYAGFLSSLGVTYSDTLGQGHDALVGKVSLAIGF
jgi:hypothetical protein